MEAEEELFLPREGAAKVAFELRVYHASEGKLEALMTRFRDHTSRLFKKHGMLDIAYFTPTDDPLKGETLVYLLQHESREAAMKSWASLAADPEWLQVVATTEADGKLAEKIESTYMTRAYLEGERTQGT